MTYCENCGKRSNPTSYDLEQEKSRIDTGFRPSLCSCTTNQLEAAKEANFYASQVDYYDKALIFRPNNRSNARAGQRAYKNWEKAAKQADKS